MRLKSSGGNQPNLNLGIVKKTEIPLPTLEEQEQIVSQIEQGFSLIENSQRIVNSTLQALKIMRMSVLKQAFQGKLVPQDPNDEPASVLLERIKKQKS
jgi:type I restriction enzyme S subunit